jgi:hypothetical protein
MQYIVLKNNHFFKIFFKLQKIRNIPDDEFAIRASVFYRTRPRPLLYTNSPPPDSYRDPLC